MQIVILRSEATKNLILQTMGFFTPVGRSEGRMEYLSDWEYHLCEPNPCTEVCTYTHTKEQSVGDGHSWLSLKPLCLKSSALLIVVRTRRRGITVKELKAEIYKPSPVLRVYIPKGRYEKRPLGIPIVKDRLVQQAISPRMPPTESIGGIGIFWILKLSEDKTKLTNFKRGVVTSIWGRVVVGGYGLQPTSLYDTIKQF